MKRLFAIVFALVVAAQAAFVYADTADDILGGKYDSLILGTVKDVGDDYVTVTVDNIVGSDSDMLKDKDITTDKFTFSYCDKHVPEEFNKPKVGDNIFLSLKKDGDGYGVTCAYKIDSSEQKNCSTLVYQDMQGEKCFEDAVKIAYFIRSNGKITEFDTASEDGKIYAVSGGEKVLIYPLPGNQCVRVINSSGETVDEGGDTDVMPIVSANAPQHDNNDRRTVISLVIMCGGVVVGFFAFYFFYAKKRM